MILVLYLPQWMESHYGWYDATHYYYAYLYAHYCKKENSFSKVFETLFIKTIFHKILEEFLKRKWSESDLEILPRKGGESLGRLRNQAFPSQRSLNNFHKISQWKF